MEVIILMVNEGPVQMEMESREGEKKRGKKRESQYRGWRRMKCVENNKLSGGICLLKLITAVQQVKEERGKEGGREGEREKKNR